MRFYFDKARGKLVVKPGLQGGVVRASVKRGDALTLAVEFYDGATLGSVTGTDLVFVVKATPAGDALAIADTWSESAGVYTAILDTNTQELLDALGSEDSLKLQGELTFSEDGGTTWTSSQTIEFTVNNDLYKGVEGPVSTLGVNRVALWRPDITGVSDAAASATWSTVAAVAAGSVTIGGNVMRFVWGEGPYQENTIVLAEPALPEVAAGYVADVINGEMSTSAFDTPHLANPSGAWEVTAAVAAGVMTATAKESGAAGNGIAVDTDATGAAWGSATLEGGAAGLREVATVDLTGSPLLFVYIGTGWISYALLEGTAAESGATIVRPDDYEAGVNEKYWRMMAISGDGIGILGDVLIGSDAAVYNAVLTLDDEATVASTPGQISKVTLAGNRTLAKPTWDSAIAIDGATVLIEVTQGAGGSHTLAYAAGIKWPAGTAPTLSTAAGAIDIITLITFDGGATWYGSFLGDLS